MKLYNVLLKVHSPHGTFEGYFSDTPLEKEKALALVEEYSGIIDEVQAVNMKLVGQDQRKMVVPKDVLSKSVMIFQVQEVEPPATE